MGSLPPRHEDRKTGTVCTSLDPFNMVIYNINLVKTSWTYSSMMDINRLANRRTERQADSNNIILNSLQFTKGSFKLKAVFVKDVQTTKKYILHF